MIVAEKSDRIRFVEHSVPVRVDGDPVRHGGELVDRPAPLPDRVIRKRDLHIREEVLVEHHHARPVDTAVGGVVRSGAHVLPHRKLAHRLLRPPRHIEVEFVDVEEVVGIALDPEVAGPPVLSDVHVEAVVPARHALLKRALSGIVAAGLEHREAYVEPILEVFLRVVKLVVEGRSGHLVAQDVSPGVAVVEEAGEDAEVIPVEIRIAEAVLQISGLRLLRKVSLRIGAGRVGGGLRCRIGWIGVLFGLTACRERCHKHKRGEDERKRFFMALSFHS